MGPLRLNQESLFPFVLQGSKLESIRNYDEKWSIIFFCSFPEGVYNQSQSGKKMCFLVIVLNLTFGRIHIGLVTEIG